jgi:hypothetical protein
MSVRKSKPRPKKKKKVSVEIEFGPSGYYSVFTNSEMQRHMERYQSKQTDSSWGLYYSFGSSHTARYSLPRQKVNGFVKPFLKDPEVLKIVVYENHIKLKTLKSVASKPRSHRTGGASSVCDECLTFRTQFVDPLKLYSLPNDRLQYYTNVCEQCFNQEIQRCNDMKRDLQSLANSNEGNRNLNYTPQQIENQWHRCLQATDPWYKAKELGKKQLERNAQSNYANANAWNAARILRDAPQVPSNPVRRGGHKNKNKKQSICLCSSICQ